MARLNALQLRKLADVLDDLTRSAENNGHRVTSSYGGLYVELDVADDQRPDFVQVYGYGAEPYTVEVGP